MQNSLVGLSLVRACLAPLCPTPPSGWMPLALHCAYRPNYMQEGRLILTSPRTGCGKWEMGSGGIKQQWRVLLHKADKRWVVKEDSRMLMFCKLIKYLARGGRLVPMQTGKLEEWISTSGTMDQRNGVSAYNMSIYRLSHSDVTVVRSLLDPECANCDSHSV